RCSEYSASRSVSSDEVMSLTTLSFQSWIKESTSLLAATYTSSWLAYIYVNKAGADLKLINKVQYHKIRFLRYMATAIIILYYFLFCNIPKYWHIGENQAKCFYSNLRAFNFMTDGKVKTLLSNKITLLGLAA